MRLSVTLLNASKNKVNLDLSNSPTKDLPIGKLKGRYRSSSRWSLTLSKTIEIRHILRDNKIRYNERQEIKKKKREIWRESRYNDAFPFPRHKNIPKVIDYESQMKTFFINPSSVSIEPKDVLDVTPEQLPNLSTKIQDMRKNDVSWQTIFIHVIRDYTSHLKGIRI